MKTRLSLRAAISVLTLILAALPAAGIGTEVVLKGTVHYLDQQDLSLSKKMDSARQEFIKCGADRPGQKDDEAALKFFEEILLKR